MSEKVIKKFESEMKDFQDRLEALEARMHSLEEIPKKLQQLKEAIIEVIGVLGIGLDIDSCIRDFMFVADRTNVEGVKTLMGTYLKHMKKFFEEYDKEPWKESVSQFMKRWTSIIFMTASMKRIGFDDFCSIIIENLGSDLAKKTIAIEDIVKFYGAENASTWKRLIK